MEKAPVVVASGDDLEWAERSAYWQQYRPAKWGREKKFTYREPLILSGHGVRINVHRNTLLIRPGFTHYPQKQDNIRFFPGDANLPDRIIILDADGGISFDALAWMAGQRIEFVQLDWRGNATAIGGNLGYIANPKLADIQRKIRNSTEKLEIARFLIDLKLRASADTLKAAIPNSEKSQKCISEIGNWIARLEDANATNSIPQILGAEGAAAQIYFNAWQGIPLKWSGLSRKPIPPDWHEVGPRRMTWRRRANDARHPVNAMLNYGYAILNSKVKAEILAAGFDPSIGIVHGKQSGAIPLVYDLMEPLRPVVDAKVLAFLQAHTFRPGDFTINSLGACRLNPEMSRAVVRAIDTDARSEVHRFKNLLA